MTRALRSRNYRLFFFGNFVSLIGNWMTTVAMGWLVYRLTGSELKLGLVGFAGQFPTFILSPVAGVLVDRWPLRRVLVITQSLAMLQSFALAGLIFAGWATFEHVVWLALVQGFVNAVDIPARQAFVVQLLDDRRDLPNAIALNSSIVNGARLIGPSVAGFLIAFTGEAWCFFADGVSYVAVIISLLAMTVAMQPRREHAPVLQSLREGFAVSFGFAPIRAILLLLACVSLAGVPYTVLMPVFAKSVLHGDSSLYGLLTGASGAGALCGGIYLATRKSVVGMGKMLVIASATFGVALIAFSFSRVPALSLAIMPFIGFAMIVQMAGSNTLLQTLAEDHHRGRVMAMFTMCFMGTVPIGSLIAGTTSERIGAPWTVFMGGCLCIVAASVFAMMLPKLRPLIRPIYVKRGILPEIAIGMSEANVATNPANR